MQVAFASRMDPSTRFELPDEDEDVMPGVPWGRPSQFFTPAYWVVRSKAHERLETYGRFKTGRCLVEEYAHCLLGGHGITAEMGWAAFKRIAGSGLLFGNATPERYEALLVEPLVVNGRMIRYRFPRRKAGQLAAGVPVVARFAEMELTDLELRTRLMELPGVGPKTASWVVRNHRGSDDVAIIDIHIARAGKRMGLFDDGAHPARNYFGMERSFLEFANAVQVRASVLDQMMWDIIRRIG